MPYSSGYSPSRGSLVIHQITEIGSEGAVRTNDDCVAMHGSSAAFVNAHDTKTSLTKNGLLGQA